MENEKIIQAMAKEIAELRKQNDHEYGLYCEKDYKITNIIEEYKNKEV